MGAWGYGPFDNDSALDWVSYFTNPFSKSLNKLVKSRDPDPNELRAAASIVIQLHKVNNLWFDQELIAKLADRLQCVIDEKDWFDTWVDRRDAMGIKREIRGYIRKLRELDGY